MVSFVQVELLVRCPKRMAILRTAKVLATTLNACALSPKIVIDLADPKRGVTRAGREPKDDAGVWSPHTTQWLAIRSESL